MRESRVQEAQSPAAGLRRCETCDVTWWGDHDAGCWFCGSPGTFASATRRVVADESAA